MVPKKVTRHPARPTSQNLVSNILELLTVY
jgi:hypothetical protein